MDQRPTLLAYLHPILALSAIAGLAFVASLGLRSRDRGNAALRPRHARLALLAFAGILLAAFSGAISTRLWRPDLEPASGWHFRLALIEIAVLGAAALLSRRLPGDAAARRVHPLLGLVALLIALLQVFFGLGLTRF